MNKKLLFVHTNYSTFVKTDCDLLSTRYAVTRYQFKPVKGLWKNAIQFLRQKIYLLFNIWKFDAVFIWFADYHSFLPVLFSKLRGIPSYVVIGGYDVADIAELHYGSLSSPLRKAMTRYTFKNATLCLPVVDALEEKLKKVCPGTRARTVYTGYAFFNGSGSSNPVREKMVLTVSITRGYQRFMVKGLDRFRELAARVPEFEFIIIGVDPSAHALFETIPENLTLLPPQPQHMLATYYSRASFYAQLSRSEGLPNALCEGMLYGCIPLGTAIGGIPTAIGSTGLVLTEWNADEAASFIRSRHPHPDRSIFKTRIEEKFDLAKRKESLLNLLP